MKAKMSRKGRLGMMLAGLCLLIWPTMASAYTRPFGHRAAWNVPIRVNGKLTVPIHPQSAMYVDRYWSTSHGFGTSPAEYGGTPYLNFDVGGYTYPVYYTSDATTTYKIQGATHSWIQGNQNGQSLPWNPAWKPSVGTDAQIILLNADKGMEYDFWAVSSIDHANKIVHCTTASRMGDGVKDADSTGAGNYWTKENGWYSTRGVNIQTFAMLVVPEEIKQGLIPHALSNPVNNTHGMITFAPDPGPPEHPNHDDTGLPEGMRLALNVTEADIDAWIAAMPSGTTDQMKSFARTVARALRDYGWIITDTSGSSHLQFEAPESALSKWTALGVQPAQYPRLTGKTYDYPARCCRAWSPRIGLSY